MLPCKLSATIAGMAVAVLLCNSATAQMFGNRQVGRPLTRQSQPGFDQEQEDVGSLQGNERFLRKNRRPTDFVGPDLRELQRFIGILQASARGQATSATQGIRRRVDRSETVNQPLPAVPRGAMYHPQVDIDYATLEVIPPEPGSLESNALDTLARSTQLSGSSRIAVLVEGRTAILRGAVPSAKERDLAEVLLSFEPGISSIRNELVIDRQPSTGPEPLQSRRDRRTPRQAWTTMSHGSTAATRSPVWNSPSSRSY